MNEPGLAADFVEEGYILDGEGRKTAIIIPIEDYNQLLEDVHDLAVVLERSSERPISLAEMKARLNQHETV